MRYIFLLFPCLLLAKLPFPPFHKATYQLGWDLYFSPYAGGEDLLFLHRAIERFEIYTVSKTTLPYSKTASARFWRFSELYLGWMPLNYLATAVQHEVFGHGYRIREMGRGRAKVKGYSFDTPIPYGFGGAATHYKITPSLTTTEESAIAMAGVESTAILALLTKFKWLESKAIDPRQTILYFLSQQDLNLYIGTLDSNDTDLEGHDIHSYIKAVNYTYTDATLHDHTLHALSWINLADPFTFYALYAWFHYISSGKETRIPMIPLFNWGYLPALRLGLTPFGPEIFIENYLSQQNRSIYFYLKGGSHSENQYGGAGVYIPKLYSFRNWFCGLRLDLWRQPKLLLQGGTTPFLEIDFDEPPNREAPLYSYPEQHAMRIGGAGSLLLGYATTSGFEVELGYKSKGFLPGYALRASPTCRLFYSLNY